MVYGLRVGHAQILPVRMLHPIFQVLWKGSQLSTSNTFDTWFDFQNMVVHDGRAKAKSIFSL